MYLYISKNKYNNHITCGILKLFCVNALFASHFMVPHRGKSISLISINRLYYSSYQADMSLACIGLHTIFRNYLADLRKSAASFVRKLTIQKAWSSPYSPMTYINVKQHPNTKLGVSHIEYRGKRYPQDTSYILISIYFKHLK